MTAREGRRNTVGAVATGTGRRVTITLVAAVLVATACTSDDQSTPSSTTSEAAVSTSSPTSAAPPASAVPGGTISSTSPAASVPPDALAIESFAVPDGTHPHDVAPAADGGVWYTAQHLGELGWLDPATGDTHGTDLGSGSRPHGVIVDDDGTPWITDGGLNAIVAVDPDTLEPTVYPLPDDRANANLNTATFDDQDVLWFTGQDGVYGSLDPASGQITVYDAPRGRGPYGITTTPDGVVYLASLAGSYVGAVQPDGSLEVFEPPTPNQGARRVWSDSAGAIWVSEWNSGNLSRYVPQTGDWTTWPLPGDSSAYAVYVDEANIVWVSDFGANAIVRFDPATEEFTQIPLPHEAGEVRQLVGRPGEVWGAESAADRLVVIHTTE